MAPATLLASKLVSVTKKSTFKSTQCHLQSPVSWQTTNHPAILWHCPFYFTREELYEMNDSFFVLDPAACQRVVGHGRSAWVYFAALRESSDLDISIQINWTRRKFFVQTLPKLYSWITNLASWNKHNCSMGGALTRRQHCALQFWCVTSCGQRECLYSTQTFISAKRGKSTEFLWFSNVEILFFMQTRLLNLIRTWPEFNLRSTCSTVIVCRWQLY